MIAVIDYGIGNLRSVENAFRAIGEEPCIVRDPRLFTNAQAIVLPGVGAFSEAMRRLHDLGFVDALESEVARNGRPFLGLCLGMQLLATEGHEHGVHRGLGWIEGTVNRMPQHAAAETVRVPHIGWNDLQVVRRDGLLRDVGESPSFYYVHSYVFAPADQAVATGLTTHGQTFAAVVERDNVFGTQFHPEKSQRAGLALLRRFMEIARGSC